MLLKSEEITERVVHFIIRCLRTGVWELLVNLVCGICARDNKRKVLEVSDKLVIYNAYSM